MADRRTITVKDIVKDVGSISCPYDLFVDAKAEDMPCQRTTRDNEEINCNECWGSWWRKKTVNNEQA